MIEIKDLFRNVSDTMSNPKMDLNLLGSLLASKLGGYKKDNSHKNMLLYFESLREIHLSSSEEREKKSEFGYYSETLSEKYLFLLKEKEKKILIYFNKNFQENFVTFSQSSLMPSEFSIKKREMSRSGAKNIEFESINKVYVRLIEKNIFDIIVFDYDNIFEKGILGDTLMYSACLRNDVQIYLMKDVGEIVVFVEYGDFITNGYKSFDSAVRYHMAKDYM